MRQLFGADSNVEPGRGAPFCFTSVRRRSGTRRSGLIVSLWKPALQPRLEAPSEHWNPALDFGLCLRTLRLCDLVQANRAPGALIIAFSGTGLVTAGKLQSRSHGRLSISIIPYSHMPSKTVHECSLLYVEDDDATAYLFQTALQHTSLSPQLFRATNGEDALRFLFQTGAYRDAPQPDLVLLDLNLPRKSGFDVLAEMKSDPRLREIKVVVFSTSTLPYDREKSLELGADDYLNKEGDFDSFIKVAESVCQRLRPER